MTASGDCTNEETEKDLSEGINENVKKPGLSSMEKSFYYKVTGVSEQ